MPGSFSQDQNWLHMVQISCNRTPPLLGCVNEALHVQGFRQWFLGTLDIPTQAPDRKGSPVRVTFISRKPYGKKRKLTRQIANEEELFAMVQSMPGVQARKADFAQISLADQLQLVATDTDILVGE